MSHVAKLKNLEILKLNGSIIYLTPLEFEKICNECVSLKSLSISGLQTAGNFLSHVSKLEELELFFLSTVWSYSNSVDLSYFRGWSSSNITYLWLEEISGINLQVS